ncbi:hypothetical protein [Herminiimonas sp.]|uniref:hypothetical protein n=1 Tax=Herminiimonas sp. TaxID=1926289 RepID=UPI002720CF64|nr:hypothetical protein [Herminiimonas sp.]MDO8306102.1 hypothetical protein [Herminiimonas sp.]
MKLMPLDQIQLVWYQDSITGEASAGGFKSGTHSFWVHLEYFPRELTEAYLMEEGDDRPHPKDGWFYARGILL